MSNIFKRAKKLIRSKSAYASDQVQETGHPVFGVWRRSESMLARTATTPEQEEQPLPSSNSISKAPNGSVPGQAQSDSRVLVPFDVTAPRPSMPVPYLAASQPSPLDGLGAEQDRANEVLQANAEKELNCSKCGYTVDTAGPCRRRVTNSALVIF